jgi:hypothetical protein
MWHPLGLMALRRWNTTSETQWSTEIEKPSSERNTGLDGNCTKPETISNPLVWGRSALAFADANGVAQGHGPNLIELAASF